LKKNTSNDEVREKATGALWILENSDQHETEPTSAKRGLSALLLYCGFGK